MNVDAYIYMSDSVVWRYIYMYVEVSVYVSDMYVCGYIHAYRCKCLTRRRKDMDLDM